MPKISPLPDMGSSEDFNGIEVTALHEQPKPRHNKDLICVDDFE